MKYRKRPVEIEAVQWTGKNLEECKAFLGDSYLLHSAERRPDGRSEIGIKTLEGQHIASRDDYLIRGVKGEHYPCKPDIFAMTYEPVEAGKEVSDGKNRPNKIYVNS
jgi:hypothetical protein